MSDLISRKAAIDKIYSLKRERVNPPETDKAMNYILEVAASCLYYLPSAQPEITLESAIDYLHSIGWMQEHDRILTESAQQKIIRCKDCGHADWCGLPEGMIYCMVHEHYLSENDYCSYGVKEDG